MATTFSVPFVHGLQRHRMANGHAYDTQRNKVDKMHIAAAYRAAGGRMFSEPVALEVVCCLPLAKGKPKCVTREAFTCKPDCDNVAKLVADALNGVAFGDDSQVVTLHVYKMDRTRQQKTQTVVTVSPAAAAASVDADG